MNVDWQTVIVAVFALLVLAFISVVWLTRDPRSRHVRVGLFLERDDHEASAVIDPLAPPVVRPDGEADVEGE